VADEATFSVEVLTPEGEVFSGEVTRLSTRTVVGEVGILANHVPILAGLKPTRLRLYRSDSDPVEFAQSHGTFQVFANQAEILVEEAIPVTELEPAALEAQLEDARSRAED
jgi:F-type H+-transporting ATPase subunit epsilon